MINFPTKTTVGRNSKKYLEMISLLGINYIFLVSFTTERHFLSIALLIEVFNNNSLKNPGLTFLMASFRPVQQFTQVWLYMDLQGFHCKILTEISLRHFINLISNLIKMHDILRFQNSIFNQFY